MVAVGNPFLDSGGQIGGLTDAQRAEIQARLAQQAANIEARRAFLAAERAAQQGTGGGYVAPAGTVGGFEVPNNFWGFAMLMMGMR